MKTPDDYASYLGTRTSTFAECRDLFAEAINDARREALEEVDKLIAQEADGCTQVGDFEGVQTAIRIREDIRALLETAVKP